LRRDHARQRRLPGARRAPQDHRGHAIGADDLLEQAPLADELRLPDHLAEAARSHPLRERHALGIALARVIEEVHETPRTVAGRPEMARTAKSRRPAGAKRRRRPTGTRRPATGSRAKVRSTVATRFWEGGPI